MTILQTIFLGVVEGITEFLPISSTFHLIWAAKILHIPQTDFQKIFEVVIQSGAILAVAVIYINVLRQEKELIKKVIVSFFPTAIIGLILYKIIKNIFFENLPLQLGVFALLGLVFILFEKSRQSHIYTRLASDISYLEAIGVGIAQSLAVVPGVSRAGAVILALMYLHVKRDEAAKYSFLLAVPTILSASALDLYKSRDIAITSYEWLLMLIGFIVAFVSALLVMKWLIKFLQSNTISIFGWYRLAIALALLFII